MSVLLILSLCACSFSFSTANFQNLVMASEINEDTFKPVTATDTFSINTPKIYLTGSLNNAPGDTVIKAKWIYIENDPAVEIDSATYEAKDSDVDFQFNLSIPENGWPVGKYEVKLYLDDKIEKAVKFEVAASNDDTTVTATEAETTVTVPETTIVISETIVATADNEDAYFDDLATSVNMNEDTYEPIGVTSVFSTATPVIYLTGSLYSATIGDTLAAYWQYTEDDPALDIGDKAYTMENVDSIFYFSLSMPDDGWAIGQYEIFLYVNDIYVTSAFFEVA